MIKKLLLVIFLFTVCATATPAQKTPEQSILNAQDQFFDIKKRSIELERVKRDSEKRPVNKDNHSKFPEIKKDFEAIQKINLELFRLTSSKIPLDHSAVAKLASEINQRSLRLRANLFEPESGQKETEEKQQSALASKSLETLLSALDESIGSFVHSSIFQNLKLVDTADSLKAQKDLETVINLSQAIKLRTKK